MRLHTRAAAITLLLSIALPALPRDRDYLPPEVTQALTRGRIPATSLSVYVREVGRSADALVQLEYAQGAAAIATARASRCLRAEP